MRLKTDLKLGPKSVILRPCRELAHGRGLCPNLRPGPAPAVVGRAPRRPRNAPTDRPDLMPGASEAGPIPHRRAKFHARTIRRRRGRTYPESDPRAAGFRVRGRPARSGGPGAGHRGGASPPGAPAADVVRVHAAGPGVRYPGPPAVRVRAAVGPPGPLRLRAAPRGLSHMWRAGGDGPLGHGQQHLTTTYAWFLARWAKRLNWTEVAAAFRTTWDHVCDAGEMAGAWGRHHQDLTGITALGLDELQWRRGHQ